MVLLETTSVTNTYENSKKGEDYVYILRLFDGKFYVGYTANLRLKLYYQFTNTDTSFTKAFKPISVMNIIGGDKTVQKQITLEMMKLHGVDNVRGYCWSAVILNNRPTNDRINSVEIKYLK